MRAWLEGGVLYLFPTIGEYAALRALLGRPVTSGIIPLRGIGTAGGFMVRPEVHEVQTAEGETPAVR